RGGDRGSPPDDRDGAPQWPIGRPSRSSRTSSPSASGSARPSRRCATRPTGPSASCRSSRSPSSALQSRSCSSAGASPATGRRKRRSVRELPFATETEPPAPSSPYHLHGGQWLSAVKASGKEFLKDDCLGLSQEIAYSALLAFFPSVILVVG